MNASKYWMMALVTLLLAACSEEPPPPPPKKNVFDSLTQTEQRARDVQTTVDENAARQRQATDAQERGDKAP